MLTKWKVSNFKSIQEETELPLGPLTIFAGANSSGKSTFIQSILLVAQTLAHKVSTRSVVLNGALTSLGQFDDLKSDGRDFDQITIKCTCRPLSDKDTDSPRRPPYGVRGTAYYGPGFDQLQEIACEMSFDADRSSAQRDFFQIQPRLFATHLSCVFRDEDNLDQKSDIEIRHSSKGIYEIDGIEDVGEIDDRLREGLAYEVDIDDSSLAEVHENFESARPIGCILRHFLPHRIIYALDAIQEDANAIIRALQDDSPRFIAFRRNIGSDILLSVDIISVLRDALDGIIDFDQAFQGNFQQETLLGADSGSLTLRNWHDRLHRMPREERIRVQHVLLESENLYESIYSAVKKTGVSSSISRPFMSIRPPDQIAEATRYLENFFASSLKYLGPLRDAPKPLYPLTPAADPNDVGLRGEHIASILELHKNRRIRYIPSANFKAPVVNRKMVTRTLETAVIDWLQYLGVASSVQSCDQGKLGHELKVRLADSDSTHDLTHVGVGVSQVLPILVMCLLAETDSTLVFEQPELHLHPKVQTLLGDFFLSMALSNKQCLVETHSEYFIDRLRFRIASASPEAELNSQTKIYFVENPSQGSSFREVEINEYGAILDWPEGFFDKSQQQTEDILRAAALKRKSKRKKGDA